MLSIARHAVDRFIGIARSVEYMVLCAFAPLKILRSSRTCGLDALKPLFAKTAPFWDGKQALFNIGSFEPIKINPSDKGILLIAYSMQIALFSCLLAQVNGIWLMRRNFLFELK